MPGRRAEDEESVAEEDDDDLISPIVAPKVAL
jgi:hypothetical protein